MSTTSNLATTPATPSSEHERGLAVADVVALVAVPAPADGDDRLARALHPHLDPQVDEAGTVFALSLS